MDKRSEERDWLKIFQQEKELREQYNKGSDYAAHEIASIKKLQSKKKD